MTMLLANQGPVLHIQAMGKLTGADYAVFLPTVEQFLAEHGSARILFEMTDFHGWDVRALWADAKFGAKHFREIERMALVGEAPWQEWMASFCQHFLPCEVRYFTHDHLPAARAWLSDDVY